MLLKNTSRKPVLGKLADIISQVKRTHHIRVAIDGIDASGKTTLADDLVEPLVKHGRTVIRASIDSFHNPLAHRYKRGRNSPEGYYLDSFNHTGVIESLLNPLGPNGAGWYKVATFNYKTDSPVEPPLQKAPKDAILLFDGIFLQRTELFRFWDLRIFVHISFSESVQRAIKRNSEMSPKYLKERYHKRYIPGQKLYFSKANPLERAEVIVFNSDFQNPRLSFNRRLE